MTADTRNWFKRHFALLVAALVILPMMAVVASYAYAALGALPDVRFTGEQIDALSWLPVISLYAGAAVVLAVFFNNTFTYEPGRETERAWHTAALGGDLNARWLLIRNDVRWFFLLAMAGYFFGMNR
jgi:hypothetical protein